MAIANHLLKDFKKIDYENQYIDVLVNDEHIDYSVYVKKYTICNKEVPVYNFKINIENLNNDDHLVFRLNKKLKFEYYDSDERTYMLTAEDDNNYYSIIAYDSDYDFGSNKFINEDYSYAFSCDDKQNYIDYYIVNDPKKFLKYEVDYIINIWYVEIPKIECTNKSEEIFESIDDELT